MVIAYQTEGQPKTPSDLDTFLQAWNPEGM